MDRRKDKVYKIQKKTTKISYRFDDYTTKRRNEVFDKVRVKLDDVISDSAIARALYQMLEDYPLTEKRLVKEITTYLRKNG